MLGLNSFRSQLLFLIIGLFTLVLASVFFAVNKANQNNARAHIEEALGLTSFAFQRDLASRNNVLIEKARILSADFAFKEAVATNDKNTIFSALDNHRTRVDAGVMMLADMDGELIVNTLNEGQKKGQDAEVWPLATLQESAENSESGEASGIQLLDGKPYQLVIMPLFTPEPSAWIVIGFRINDSFSTMLSEQTNSQVSLLYKKSAQKLEGDKQLGDQKGGDQKWQVLSSTLEKSTQEFLLGYLQDSLSTQITELHSLNSVKDIDLGQRKYLSRIIDVKGEGQGRTIAVLQRSLDKALEPYMRLSKLMLALFGLGLLSAVIGIFYIARNLSRPLEALTETVKRIDKGEYQKQNLLTERKDELGTLTSAVNRMSQGLQERDEVRNLLGKVVSPEIAAELLSKDINLGGEKKQATVLFSDIREFTSLCEQRDPKDVLLLLNRYLSRMTDSIELHKGVIDKYIGDAIMALFNVPIDLENAPEQAVKAAQGMVSSLEALNIELSKEKVPNINIGIGINTGEVVAGNMGSSHRLNYSVIGDGVNLASRLEGLTKYFGVSIIVSELTAQSCKNIEFRELGKVQVKGKEESIRIFEPLSPGALTEKKAELLNQFQTALEHFRKQQWQHSRDVFQNLVQQNSSMGSANDELIYQLYLENIEVLSQQDVCENWSGELVFDHK